MPTNLKTQQWPQDWKRSVFNSIPKAMPKNVQTIAQLYSFHMVANRILQVRLQQYMNHELPDVQDRFKKGKGTYVQIANIFWIMERARDFQKKPFFCFIDYAKSFDCVDHNKL